MSAIAYHSRTAALLLTALFVVVGACTTLGAFAPAASAAPVAAAPSSGATAGTAPATPAPLQQPGTDTSTYGWVMTMIMGLFAWLVGVAAITLDNAVYYSVVTMGTFVHQLDAIGVSWRILRDIGNIFLIFGFVAAGVTTILNVDWYGVGTKMLPLLLVAAVFLNFSLFISMAVIDVGNLFATQFYTQINNGEPPGKKSASLQGISNEGISKALMSKLGLQEIYGKALKENENTKTGGTGGTSLFTKDTPWYIGFMGILLFLITAFVFFSLAFILIARFVALIFLMVVAPIGFAGLAVPKLAGVAQMWWGQLFEQTITAPVLLLLLYVALAVLTDKNFFTCTDTGANCSWTGIQSGDIDGFAVLFFSFLVAMGLLLAVVIIAKRMSAFGGTMAMKFGGKMSFGAVAWGGRLTLGTAGNALTSQKAMAWAERGKYTKYLRRIPVFAGRGLRNVTFDARNMAGIGSALGYAGAGDASKLTPYQVEEFRKKYQLGIPGTKVQKGTFWKEGDAEYEAAGRAIEAKKNIKEAVETADDDLAQRTLGRMSTKELEELDGIKQGIEVLVRNLSPEQFENLMKSDKISESSKEKMKANRYGSLISTLSTDLSTIPPGATRDARRDEMRDEIRQWNAKDLALAAPGILRDPIQTENMTSLASDGQIEAVTKNDRLTRNEQQQLRDFGKTGQINNLFDIIGGKPPRNPAVIGMINGGPGRSTTMTVGGAQAHAQRILGNMTPKAIAKLPGYVVTNPLTIGIYTPKHLQALMSDGDLEPSQVATIYTAIIAGPTAGHFTDYFDTTKNAAAAAFWT